MSKAMAGERRTLVGQVVSNKMDKTVVVEVQTVKRHPVYRRIVRQRRRYKAHDENNTCALGDLVRISEHRPISKDKRWLVRAIIGRKEAIVPWEALEAEEEKILAAPIAMEPRSEEEEEEDEDEDEEDEYDDEDEDTESRASEEEKK